MKGIKAEKALKSALEILKSELLANPKLPYRGGL